MWFSLAKIAFAQPLVEFATSPIMPEHRELARHIDDDL